MLLGKEDFEEAKRVIVSYLKNEWTLFDEDHQHQIDTLFYDESCGCFTGWMLGDEYTSLLGYNGLCVDRGPDYDEATKWRLDEPGYCYFCPLNGIIYVLMEGD